MATEASANEEVDVYLLQVFTCINFLLWLKKLIFKNDVQAKITQQQSLIKEHKKQTPVPPAVSLPADHYQRLQEMVNELNNLRAQMNALQNQNQDKG